MIEMLIFSGAAALLVFLAGRSDKARDPRLTTLALALLAVFPLLLAFMPKAEVLPQGAASVSIAPFQWMKWVVVAWCVGFFFTAIQLALTVRTISGWRKDSELIGKVEGVELRQLSRLKGPVAAGVFRPVIFVPDAWDSWSDETRRIVLAHEMTHHRRRDPLWRWVAEIACMVNGCNPLVFWMARRLAVQCEFACDATVLAKGVGAGDYARLLCDFAEQGLPRGPVLAMSDRSSLESRVRRLMAPGKRLSTIGFMMLVASTMALAGAVSSLQRKVQPDISIPGTEVDLRWSADPFPDEK